MNISHLEKADVLVALYNGSRPLGMGFLHATPEDMTKEEAQSLLDSGQTYFDYVNGRVMKINLSGDDLDTTLYNRDMGENSAETIIKRMEMRK
jgi:hypothetical protein